MGGLCLSGVDARRRVRVGRSGRGVCRRRDSGNRRVGLSLVLRHAQRHSRRGRGRGRGGSRCRCRGRGRGRGGGGGVRGGCGCGFLVFLLVFGVFVLEQSRRIALVLVVVCGQRTLRLLRIIRTQTARIHAHTHTHSA